MRSAFIRLGRTEAVFFQGLVPSFFLSLWLFCSSFGSAATISSTFQSILASRPGIGYQVPLSESQLIQGSPGNDFVNSDGTFDDDGPNLGGIGPALPYHQTVGALNSWGVRLFDDSNNPLPTPVLYLNLGSLQWTDAFIVWNSNAGDTAIDENDAPAPGGSGLKTARLSYANPSDGFDYSSTDPDDYAALSWSTINVSGSDTLGSFGLTRSTGPYSEPQVKTFDAISARLLKLELLEGFGFDSLLTVGLDANGDPIRDKFKIIQLGEVAFYQTDAPSPPDPLGPIPEPSMLAIFAGLASVRFGRSLIQRLKK